MRLIIIVPVKLNGVAHTLRGETLLKLISFISHIHQIPLGVSIATTIRVGNELGAGRPRTAKRAAYVSVGVGGMYRNFGKVFNLANWRISKFLNSPIESYMPTYDAVHSDCKFNFHQYQSE